MARSPAWGGNSIRVGAPQSPVFGGNSIRVDWPPPPTQAPMAPPPPPPPPTPPPPPEPPRVFVPDSIYNDRVGLAERNLTNTLSGLNTDETRTRYDFGFDDPTNPYARQQESKRKFLMSGAGIKGNLANRGQLFSGLHQSLQDENQRDADKDNQALRAAYDAALDAIRRQRLAAESKRDEDKIAALNEAFVRQGVTS